MLCTLEETVEGSTHNRMTSVYSLLMANRRGVIVKDPRKSQESGFGEGSQTDEHPFPVRVSDNWKTRVGSNSKLTDPSTRRSPFLDIHCVTLTSNGVMVRLFRRLLFGAYQSRLSGVSLLCVI